MRILKIKEQKDGSAVMDIELTKEEQWQLINYAVVHILKEQIKTYKDKKKKEM
jgi:hypothetical protein